MVGYTVFMKHAEKITKAAGNARPVLKGVHHAEDGSLAVTDSHRLYVAKDAQARKDGATICPKTGESIDGTYPSIARMIPTESPAVSITLNTIEALKAAKALAACGKVTDKVPAFEISNGSLKLVDSPFMNAEYNGFVHVDGDKEITLKFNSTYFIEALELFKDAGYIQVNVNLYDNNHPFTIQQSDDLAALIMPIRRN